MKKFILPLSVAVMALAFTSCEGYNDAQYEEDFPYGPTQFAELTQGETIDLHKNCSYGGKWASDDSFVAEVNDNGVVTAKHVGVTYMAATNQPNLYYKITVNPTVTIFNNPAYGWDRTVTSDNVNNAQDDDPMLKVELANGDEVWVYELNTKFDDVLYAHYAVYAFEKVTEVNDKGKEKTTYYLLESGLWVDANSADKIADQLTQRYEVIGGTETVPGLTVYDAYSVDNATLGIETMASTPAYDFLRYFNPASSATPVLNGPTLDKVMDKILNPEEEAK